MVVTQENHLTLQKIQYGLSYSVYRYLYMLLIHFTLCLLQFQRRQVYTWLLLLVQYIKSIGYCPYVNKAFVYISVFKIYIELYSTTIFVFSCFYSIINYQDTTIRLCKNIKWNKNLIKVFISRQETPMCTRMRRLDCTLSLF